MGSANQATISVTDILQKYSLANVCESVLGVNFNVLDDKQSLMHEKIKYVKLQIFNPIFLNFPYFDNFPIPSRLKARREVIGFRKWYGQSLIEKYNLQLPNSAATKLVDSLIKKN